MNHVFAFFAMVWTHAAVGAFCIVAVVGYLYSTGSTIKWTKKK